MKGLILKDFYVMARTIKTYILVIAIYIVAFGIMGENTASAIFVCTIVISMAPVTAIAYDEQSKWDKMASAMPVRAKDIVLAKYIFSLILSFAAARLSTLASAFISSDIYVGFADLLPVMVMAVLMAMFYHSLLFPTVYKFGTTKGRIYTMLIMFLPAIITALLSFFGFWTSGVIIMFTEYGELLVICSVLGVLLLYTCSVMLSVKIYKNKEF